MTLQHGDMPSGPKSPTDSSPRSLSYLGYLAVAIATAILWSLIGGAIAFAQSRWLEFWAEWWRIQAFFCIAFGVWLFLIAGSGTFEERARRLTQEGFEPPHGTTTLWQKLLVVVPIGVGGTISVLGLGFNATGSLLAFMWAMAAFVCFIAAFVTLHTIDLLMALNNLKTSRISLFQYSPARTPRLRDLISYFTIFTFLLSVGFLFAAVGTFGGDWAADPSYVQAVQWFWPVIYVPTCTAALIYPHLAVHEVVARAKERTLSSYQREIDVLLEGYPKLEDEQVQRVNTLAQLFDRISATPDYVFDLGIAFRTALPLVFKVAIVAAKPILGGS